jgi:hypothetical protein
MANTVGSRLRQGALGMFSPGDCAGKSSLDREFQQICRLTGGPTIVDSIS